MINLLPLEEKQQLRAARTNGLLIRYNLFMLSALVFLGIAIGVTYIYLTNAKTVAEQTITDNQSKVSSYNSIKSQADVFRTNLATAKLILDREVTYSKVVLDIAKVLPKGVILENLNLDSQTFGTETTLVARAKSYNNALALKDAFQNSSLFKDVHFQSIDSTPSDEADEYPFTVNLNVTIQKGVAK